jgi:prepilin-type N-terminal cleavage/methylation domain-containing protein
MKKQSGFTLIELLLVLAIIGIISAIAIPALLGQRARARDKSAISNTDSIVSDLVAAYDKAREQGTVLTVTNFEATLCGTAAAPLIPQYWAAQNPWGGTGALAYAYLQGATATETDNLGTGTAASATATNLGQVATGFLPVVAGGSGNIVASVYVNAAFNNAAGTSTHNYTRVAGIE